MRGPLDTAIADLYKTSGFQRYVVVFSDRTDNYQAEIRRKTYELVACLQWWSF